MQFRSSSRQLRQASGFILMLVSWARRPSPCAGQSSGQAFSLLAAGHPPPARGSTCGDRAVQRGLSQQASAVRAQRRRATEGERKCTHSWCGAGGVLCRGARQTECPATKAGAGDKGWGGGLSLRFAPGVLVLLRTTPPAASSLNKPELESLVFRGFYLLSRR